ncbi:Uncharacterized protein TCAP_01370 [Tolypocladium capitatum]|uniref:ABM domain-containing protein n=1 Tax=Tolypocladium capitatum TaxID=45235 RepID=A0A2K3QME4_9HYPO|nr:Uncharacterized protein TCAP_01370 [Tolypocladium capitatum]
MPVTEFALLRLRGGHDHLEFLETLMECQELQDEWAHDNQPHNLESNSNLSSMYIEQSDPPSLLITAPWDSPEAHGEWIQCTENQMCNGKLSKYIAPGCSSVMLFHMDPAGKQPEMRTSFAPRGSFSVCRITVNAGQRDSLQKAYQELEDRFLSKPGGQKVWAGWRIETSGDAQDFVVFWSDAVPDERMRRLMSFSGDKDHRHFKHVV